MSPLAKGRQLVRRVLRRFDLEIVRTDTEWRSRSWILERRAVDCVLDVGANTGQYASTLRNEGWAGPIVSFEPAATVHAELSATAKADPLWTTRRSALADAEGEQVLQIAGNTYSSSLLPMAELHSKAAPESEIVGTEIVPVERLDQIIDQVAPGARRILLKVDVQGGELAVLRGAAGTLDRVVVIEAELSLAQLYEGQPRILEVCDWLADRGFVLVDLEPVFRHADTGRLLQLDGRFVRVTG